MQWQTKNEVLSLMEDLVNILSVSTTDGEIDIANFIYNELAKLDYFLKHPDHLIKTYNLDNSNRYSINALIKKGRTSNKTMLMIGHFDTVGIDDAGILKDVFNNPQEYTKLVNKLPLDSSSKEDLESNEYLFGRGVMDMKSGIAILMSLVEYYSNDINFDGNILVNFVGDEETDSNGVLSSIPVINQILTKHNLKPFVCLNTEPDFASYPNDDNRYMYLGTIGKLLAGFYVYGKETHVGESLAGLNTNLISSLIVNKMELNLDFCEISQNEFSQPPTLLKMEDHKTKYNVQTPISSHLYYNIPTFKNSPKVIMNKLTKIASDSINEAYERVLNANKQFKELSLKQLKPLSLKPQVYTYFEFYSEVKIEYPNLDNLLDEMIIKYQELGIDERDLNVKLLQEMQNLSSNKNPKVVVFYAPPYYPHVSLDNNLTNHEAVIKASNKTIEYANLTHQEEIKQCAYFQGLCDLSYFALQDAKDVLDFLKPNMPTLDKTYHLPLEDIQKLDVPVINYGPHGKDPHKYTERVLVDYSFNVVPDVLKELIKNLFEIV